jgi:hypothetical protein
MGLSRPLMGLLTFTLYKDRIWNPERKRPLGRLKYTREDNIKMDLEGIGWEGAFIWLGKVTW